MAQLDKIRLSGTTYDIIDATAVHSLDGYYTTGETNAAITAATDALAQAIAEQGYQTSGDVQTAISEAVSGKADSSAVTQEISAAVSGKADTTAVTAINDTLTAHTANTDIHVTSADKTAWNAKADIEDIPSVSGYADSVAYNSTSKYVEFYHGGTGGTKVFEYDASPFLIDGMVQNVEIKNVPGTQTFKTGFPGSSSRYPAYQASSYDTSATNAVGDYTSFSSSSSYVYKLSVKVKDENDTEITVCNNVSSLPTSEYATFTTQDKVLTIVPASGYRISYIEFFNQREDGSFPDFNGHCDWTITAATTCLVISFNTDAGKQDINIPISQIFDASNYYTKSETNTKINQSVSGRVSTYTYTAYTASTQTVINAKADTTAMTQAISEATSGKADTTAVTTVNNALTAHTSDSDIHVTSSDKTTWSGKQDQLVSGTNIKTVGGNSLLGSGNIDFPAGLQVEVSGTTLVFG